MGKSPVLLGSDQSRLMLGKNIAAFCIVPPLDQSITIVTINLFFPAVLMISLKNFRKLDIKLLHMVPL